MAKSLAISTFDGVTCRTPTVRSVSWPALRNRLRKFDVRAEKDGELWSPVSYPDGATRANGNVVDVWALVLDLDDGTPPAALAARWERWEYSIHSSFSSTPEHPKWRAVFPLNRPVPAAEWAAVHRKLSLALGDGHCDPACKDPARMYYLPAHPPGAECFAEYHPGELLDPDAFPEPPPPVRLEPARPAAERDPEGRPKRDLLLARGLEDTSEGRNNRCLWLACQLRDNDYTQAEAEETCREFARLAPSVNGKGEFTEEEAEEVVRKAYSRPAREAWGPLRDLRHEPPPEAADGPQDAASVIVPETLPEGEPAPEVDAALLEDLEDAPLDKSPSELTLARRWAREVKQRYGFFEGAQWWEYSGGQWSYSSTEQAEAEVQRFMERLRFNGVDVAVTATRVSSVLKLARAHLGVHKVAELNACPTLIPLRNGVYDTETGKLLPHDPKYFLTNQLPFDYDPTAECPRWLRFLEEVMLDTEGKVCEEWIDALQEWFGYCLTGDNAAQVSMVWVGEGRNGKGVAARALEALLGPAQCCAVPVEQLHDPYHRAELQGKLMGFVNEPDPRAMLKNGAYFKAITGGDTISARRPTEKVFSFVPFCRLVISTNSIPGTRDLSHGYFRRLLIIEWRRSFSAEDADPHLDAELKKELAGIFNWALVGLRRFRDRGSKFPELKESDRLLAEYRLGEDPVRQFIVECCDVRADYRALIDPLWKAYREWCQEAGYRDIGTVTKFGRRLLQMGYSGDVGKDKEGKSVRIRRGLRLKPEEVEEPAEEAEEADE